VDARDKPGHDEENFAGRDLIAAACSGKDAPKQKCQRAEPGLRTGGSMSNAQTPGVVGPFAGMDVPWLLAMRARTRRDHP
jgi:hypothetical protein